MHPLLRIVLAVFGGIVGLGLVAGVLGAKAPLGVSAASVDGARYRADPAEAERAGTRTLSAEEIAAGLRFAPTVLPADRESVLAAVAAARPEARRLIELVDGVTSLSLESLGGEAVGLAGERPEGFEVRLDLTAVAARDGQRGVTRVVLHELGHVVDFALVPTELERQLDAGTPAGYGCEGGGAGGCAPRAERFAESFAKWATGDIGFDLYLGYKVPPPSSLEAWGAPLSALGG